MNIDIRTLVFLLFTFAVVQAQSVQKIAIKDLPKDIQYEGIIKEAISYTDSLGQHIVITSEKDIHISDKFHHENGGRDAELFVYNYLMSKDIYILNWKVYDYISDCPFDIEVSFLKNTFNVTDLDKDGICEVWIMYKLCCRSDVSPCDMKIIMYEGIQKFAMRGYKRVFGGTNKGVAYYYGGEYTFDSAFRNGPEQFREFAEKLWEKNKMDKPYQQ